MRFEAKGTTLREWYCPACFFETFSETSGIVTRFRRSSVKGSKWVKCRSTLHFGWMLQQVEVRAFEKIAYLDAEAGHQTFGN